MAKNPTKDKYSSIPRTGLRYPKVVYTPPGTQSYYDPHEETIYAAAGENPSVMQHEMFHHWQNLNKDLQVGPVRDVPITAENPAEYYNRRQADMQDASNKFLKRNPSFLNIPLNLLYNKEVEPSMYYYPEYAEGEAEEYENYVQRGGQSVFPEYAKGGPVYNWIPKYPRTGAKYAKGGWLEKYANGGDTTSSVRESTNVVLPVKQTLVNPNNPVEVANSLLKQYNVKVDSTGNILKDIGLPSAAYYNPITRTINYKNPNYLDVSPEENKELQVMRYVGMVADELPHAIQADSLGVLPFLGKIAYEGIKDPTNERYRTKGTLEHHAHEILQPTLANKVYNHTPFSSMIQKMKKSAVNKKADGSTIEDQRIPTPTTPSYYPDYPDRTLTNYQIGTPKSNLPIRGLRDATPEIPAYGNGSKVTTRTVVTKSANPTPSLEKQINKELGYPMRKAAEAADSGEKWFNPKTKKWEKEDPVDNLRHAMAGKYTAEAIADKFPGWMQYTPIPKTVGFLGANVLGIGHELTAINKNPNYSWWDKTREAGEDIFNNLVGATAGSLPLSNEQKENILFELSRKNLLPDGYGKGNMYFKKHGGPIKYAHGATVWNKKLADKQMSADYVIGPDTNGTQVKNTYPDRMSGAENPTNYRIGDVVPTGMDYKSPAAGTYDYSKDIQPYHTMRLHAPSTTKMAKHGGEVTEEYEKRAGIPYAINPGVSDAGMYVGPTTQRGITFADGGPTGVPPASRQDSIFLLNSVNALNKYYQTSGFHNPTPEVNYKGLNIVTIPIAQSTLSQEEKDNIKTYKNYLKEFKDRGTSSSTYLDYKRRDPSMTPTKYLQLITKALQEPKDNNVYRSYYKDLFPSKIDLEAPSAIFDSRIQPQGLMSYYADEEHTKNIPTSKKAKTFLKNSPSSGSWKPGLKDGPAGNVSGFYYYDPLAITPWDMLSEAQKKQRVAEYGTSGTPISSKKPTNTSIVKNVSEPIGITKIPMRGIPLTAIKEAVPQKVIVPKTNLLPAQYMDTRGEWSSTPQVPPGYTEEQLLKMGYRAPQKKANGGWLDSYEEGGEVDLNKPYLNPATVQSVLAKANQPVTTTTGRVISTPASREKERREKVIAKNPSKYSIEDYKQGIKEPGLEDATLEVIDALSMLSGAGYLGKKGVELGIKRVAASKKLGLLSNAYKINPWAFKTQKGKIYRQVGQPGFDDAITEGKIFDKGQKQFLEANPEINYLDEYNQAINHPNSILKSLNLKKPSPAPFFSKDELFFPINRKATGIGNKKTKFSDAEYLFEGSVPEEALLPRYRDTYLKPTEATTNTFVLRPEYNDLSNFNLYKRDWLRGYKEVPTKQKKNGGWLDNL